MNKLRRLLLGKEIVRRLEQKALQTGVRYIVQNGRIVTSPDRKQTYIDKGYAINDIVYAIVNIILDKVRLPEWGLYKVVDESSLKAFNSLMRKSNLSGQDYKKAMKFKDAALEPMSSFDTRTGKLAELLKYPNDSETMSDQVASGAGYKLLTGDVFMFGDLLGAGANGGIPQSIELLPSQWTVIKMTDSFPVKDGSYEIMNLGQRFTKEQVLHEKYWNPSWSINGEQLYGMSPLKAALMNLTRNNSAKIASNAKFENGGVEEIIYMDDQRFDFDQGVEQIAAIKKSLATEYAGPANQGKKAVSGYKVGSVPLGLSPVELGIIDSEKWDALMFCAIYGVPPELLGLVQKTYNNVVEAEKALTTRSAIPLLSSRRNSLNRKIQTDWGFKGQNVYIDYSLECFTELEANRKEIVEYTSKMISISPNEERELLAMDSIADPIMDEQWVMSGGGRVPISDYQQTVVDNALNDPAAGL